MKIQRGLAELPLPLPLRSRRERARAAAAPPEPEPAAVAAFTAAVRELVLVVAEHLAEFARHRVHVARDARAAPWPAAAWADFEEQVVAAVLPQAAALRAAAATLAIDRDHLRACAAYLASPYGRHHRPADGLPPEPLRALGMPVASAIARAFAVERMVIAGESAWGWSRPAVHLGEPRHHHPLDPVNWPPTRPVTVRELRTVPTASGEPMIAGERTVTREEPHPVLEAFRAASAAAAAIVGFRGA
jgi:hypothetical protein